MPAGAVIWPKLDIMCFSFLFSVLEDSWASLGGDTTRRGYMSRSLVSYRPLAMRRPRKKAPCGRAVAPKSSILGARTHFPYYAAGPCIAAASLRRSV